MIENSDNDSASALWRSIGQARRASTPRTSGFGLTDTAGGDGHAVGADPDHGRRPTQLLRQVFGDDVAS